MSGAVYSSRSEYVWLCDVITSINQYCQSASHDVLPDDDRHKLSLLDSDSTAKARLLEFLTKAYGTLWAHAKVELLCDFVDLLTNLGCNCSEPFVATVLKILVKNALQAPPMRIKSGWRDMDIITIDFPPTSISNPAKELIISLYDKYFALEVDGSPNKAGFSDEAVKTIRELCEKIAPERLNRLHTSIKGNPDTDSNCSDDGVNVSVVEVEHVDP